MTQHTEPRAKWQRAHSLLLCVFLMSHPPGLDAGPKETDETEKQVPVKIVPVGNGGSFAVAHVSSQVENKLIIRVLKSTGSEEATFSIPSAKYWKDFAISTSKKSVCILTSREQLGRREYALMFYRLTAGADVSMPFKHHLVNRDDRQAIGEGRPEEIYERVQLQKMLRLKLDPKSPIRNKDLPELIVHRLSDVIVTYSANDCVTVFGILNDTWVFSLQLSVDEENERLSIGDLIITKLDE